MWIHNECSCSEEELQDDSSRDKVITTQSVDVWRVSELDHTQLPPSNHGQFYDGETYVVQWHFVICQKGK